MNKIDDCIDLLNSLSEIMYDNGYSLYRKVLDDLSTAFQKIYFKSSKDERISMIQSFEEEFRTLDKKLQIYEVEDYSCFQLFIVAINGLSKIFIENGAIANSLLAKEILVENN